MAQQSEFFEILKSIFNDKQSFEDYSDLTLSRNSFMINRLMSIQYPLQANVLNILHINSADIVRGKYNKKRRENRKQYFKLKSCNLF